jgi:hypothetical protein
MNLCRYASETQFLLTTEIIPRSTPDLAFLFPVVETGMTATGKTWIGLRCSHPTDPCAQIFVMRYFGERHSFLMAQRGRDWAAMRAGTLLRLLLKRLARDVAAVAERK